MAIRAGYYAQRALGVRLSRRPGSERLFGRLGGPGRRSGCRRQVQEAQAVAPDDDLVAVAQDPALHPRAVDEHAVEAAVVEHAHAVGLAHDEGVAARDGGVVEAHIGGEAAPDARPLARQRHGPQLAGLFVAEVLAGLLDALARAGDLRVMVGGNGFGERLRARWPRPEPAGARC